MSLLYDPFNRKYSIYCFDNNFSKYEELHKKEIQVKHQPYTKLLAWRIRYCLKTNLDKIDYEEDLVRTNRNFESNIPEAFEGSELSYL
jgi:hypothetical protein